MPRLARQPGAALGIGDQVWGRVLDRDVPFELVVAGAARMSDEVLPVNAAEPAGISKSRQPNAHTFGPAIDRQAPCLFGPNADRLDDLVGTDDAALGQFDGGGRDYRRPVALASAASEVRAGRHPCKTAGGAAPR